jgi:hypothetical protein
MISSGKPNPPEPVDLIRQFAVTPEGRAKFPIVERAEAPNVVRLDDYRARLASRQRPPGSHE